MENQTIKENKKPTLRYMKRSDIQNRIQLPKNLIEKFGRDFYLEIYDDCMVIIPIKKEEK